MAYHAAIADQLDAGETGPSFRIEAFNVLGAGEGLISGLLKGWIDGENWPMPRLGRSPFGSGGDGGISDTIRLTAAQAMVKWLSVQMTETGERFVEGVWANFGHGDVGANGEALHGIGEALPTLRGQNEQITAHAAIAYAKTMPSKKAMAVTSPIGPGATNMATAAALADVNRLPVLLIPGDVSANRRPDPVLQQIEDFDDGAISANVASAR